MKYDLLLNENTNNKIIDRYYLFEDEKVIRFLPNIRTVNIFVGANNSGKSWMMRHLMQIKDYKRIPLKKIDDLIINFNKSITNDIITRQQKNILLSDGALPLINIKKFENLNFNDITKTTRVNNDAFRVLDNIPEHKWAYFDKPIKKNLITILDKINLQIFALMTDIVEQENTQKIYIPTLRTAHSLYNSEGHKIEDDIFYNTLQKNYPTENVKTFTGLHLYKSILNARNARKEIRKRFEDFETFVQNNFFSGKKIDIVAEFDKDKSLNGDNSGEIITIHIDGENDTRKLYELGDGIQAIIILMYQIFMAENDSTIFIDEPELNLHPGMQRLFFEQISLNNDITKKNLTYFISTHSNHLLDLTLESDNVSIYSFNPVLEKGNKKIIVRNVNSGNNELLKDLGVNNTSVFLANSSIWVEGISDRNYIKSFLRAYCDDDNKRNYPKEDIDFAFFEYAGGNIEHYIFGDELDEIDDDEKFLKEINTLALSNKIFLFADSDMAKEGTKKFERLKLLEEKFSADNNLEGLIIRNIRESENLLSIEVWRKILIEFCNKKEVTEETQNEIDNYFSTISELNQTEYVGKFLKKIKDSGIPLNEVAKKIPRGAGEEWQTFKDKASLSRIILEKTLNKELTWDDFKTVPEVVELTEKIYQFILKRGKNMQIHNID
ncbi:AAA family ATPase [Epilithonimonas zeae]|uniref:AAA domain-containing protein, putative AbiEii toxin, Type IV TA system n=1 Tax=Epilithonimonas zeae TaxID=1416779 RepID=A0A1N6H7Y4_9FLAO|nr:AAA family ATPase [Epilithonimonas zeae]SIO15894.1 AAA domain-containing protein, putative AbiEii toxin, Type IV TA system [Epilithonimonas zeae]